MLILYWALVAVMLVGVIGSIVPLLPGPSLVVVAIVVWGLVKGFSSVGIALGVGVFVLLLCIGIDFLAGYLGAQKAGASHWGQIGAFVGFVVGVLGLLPALPVGGPLVGMFLGPLLGAIVGEYLYCRDFTVALKAGIGIVVGTIVGRLLQAVLALATMIIFLVTTFPSLSTLSTGS
ncbi:MAG: DUF456 family protein [Scytolyngbya sp. HA4215-MV1]|nr:DUF456 family protein [Scytolyngbya sp. HA4215-MV1]